MISDSVTDDNREQLPASTDSPLRHYHLNKISPIGETQLKPAQKPLGGWSGLDRNRRICLAEGVKLTLNCQMRGLVFSAPPTLLPLAVLVCLILLTVRIAKAGNLDELLSWHGSATNESSALMTQPREAMKGIPVSRVITNKDYSKICYTISLGIIPKLVTLRKDRERLPFPWEVSRDSEYVGTHVEYPRHETTSIWVHEKDTERLKGDFENFLKCCEVAKKEKLTDVKKELDNMPWPGPTLVLTFTSDENGRTALYARTSANSKDGQLGDEYDAEDVKYFRQLLSFVPEMAEEARTAPEKWAEENRRKEQNRRRAEDILNRALQSNTNQPESSVTPQTPPAPVGPSPIPDIQKATEACTTARATVQALLDASLLSTDLSVSDSCVVRGGTTRVTITVKLPSGEGRSSFADGSLRRQV